MTKEFNRSVLDLINDMQKQIGKDNPVARYVRDAVFAKLTRDKTKAFVERDTLEQESK